MVSPEREELIGVCVFPIRAFSPRSKHRPASVITFVQEKIHSKAKIESARGQKLSSETRYTCSLFSNNSISFVIRKPEVFVTYLVRFVQL